MNETAQRVNLGLSLFTGAGGGGGGGASVTVNAYPVARETGTAMRADHTWASSARIVWGPITPSAVILRDDCTRRAASAVWGP